MNSPYHKFDPQRALRESQMTRRELLQRCGMGMGGLSLGALVGADAFENPMQPKRAPYKARAKRVIHLFMNGGPSQVDTFDPKPALDKYDGKKIPLQLSTERKTGAAMKSPYSFKNYGQSGIPVSELFKHTAESVDDMCIIRSMQANVPNHEPSLMLMNCGANTLVRPSVGSWVNYGLGTDNQNLPGFISLCPNGVPIKGAQNWSNGFLPGSFQGIHVDTQHREVSKLIEYIKNDHISKPEQRRQIDLLQELNRRHLKKREGDAALDARIHSFELAYRMQMEATDAFDVEQEPKYIRDMYGEGVQARQILIARRLVERGVRYVQVWHDKDQPWDNHDDLEVNHRRLAKQCDQAIGALLKDLKQRGMLEDTLVIWGGEFGRTPVVEMPTPGSNAGKINGRDHNHYGFTMWMAGGGVKGGHIHGATDEFGFRAEQDKVHVHDLHATILALLGFDHTELTYRYAGRDFRLTDVEGHVIDDIIA